MAYKNQNYMTNKKIKAAVDKNQKGYVDPEQSQEEEQIVQSNNKFDVILSENDYNKLLSEEDNGLIRYYNKWPREDGIDANGDPVRDLETEVVGHSWESAITAPTDPKETSTFPWVVLTLDNFTGTADFQYDGESKFIWNLENRQYGIASVPNDLNMTDYRLVWGTGEAGEQTFDPSKLEVIFTPTQQKEE